MRARTILLLAGGVSLLFSSFFGQPAGAADAKPPATAPAATADVTRVYDVRDLIIAVPDFDDEPDFSPQPAPAVAPLPQPGGGLFNEGGNAKPSGPSRQEVVEQLMGYVKRSVTPEAWTTTATIRELQGQLIVTAPPETHRELRSFLADARQRYEVQVTLLVRVLDLRELEKLVGIHPDLRKKLRRAIAPFASRTGYELTADEVRQIDDATRPTFRSNMLGAPRVTLFNGQRAYVQVTTQKIFIAGYKPKPAANGFDPQMKIAQDGVVIAMQAGVSEDHKQVAMNLIVKLSELRGMGTAPFAGAPAEKSLMIDVPDVRVRALRSTISVGDQRTVVLGGFQDISKELGWSSPSTQPAPGLEDHPAAISDELIALVKPTVIVERDEKK